MKMETLMNGSQGEKAHIFYKEEDGNHMDLAYDYCFYMFVQAFSFFSCLAKIVGVVQHKVFLVQKFHLFP